MELYFKNRKLERILKSEKEIVKAYGQKNAMLIKRRMSILKAESSLAGVSHNKPERRHELKGDRKGQFAVDVNEQIRIVLKPAHNPAPEKEDGSIDLSKVTAVIILSVEDYHK
ncbi:killer suppression protein HigA [Candidatus Magnetoovum chiemensis]|nr:killer suppression protein HigA [Candidatus Magnetoovum chiemensis]